MASVGSVWTVRTRVGLDFIFADGVVQRYRTHYGHLETWATETPGWQRLTADNVLQHLALNTTVAEWMRGRIRFRFDYPCAQHS